MELGKFFARNRRPAVESREPHKLVEFFEQLTPDLQAAYVQAKAEQARDPEWEETFPPFDGGKSADCFSFFARVLAREFTLPVATLPEFPYPQRKDFADATDWQIALREAMKEAKKTPAGQAYVDGMRKLTEDIYA